MVRGKFSSVVEFLNYLREIGKWWLVPVLLIIMALSLFIVLTEGSSVLPFVYTLF